MKRTMLVMTLATMMVLPAVAFARGPGRGGGHGHGGQGGPKRCMLQAFQAANLTADQKGQLEQLRQKQQEQIKPLREQMKAKRQELRALWTSEAPNRNAILAKQDEMDAIRRQIRTARVDHRLTVMSVLTPEQRATVRNQLQSCGQGGGHHGGGMGPGGMGGPDDDIE